MDSSKKKKYYYVYTYKTDEKLKKGVLKPSLTSGPSILMFAWHWFELTWLNNFEGWKYWYKEFDLINANPDNYAIILSNFSSELWWGNISIYLVLGCRIERMQIFCITEITLF